MKPYIKETKIYTSSKNIILISEYNNKMLVKKQTFLGVDADNAAPPIRGELVDLMIPPALLVFATG